MGMGEEKRNLNEEKILTWRGLVPDPKAATRRLAQPR
jgi:hypothetical protein